jgi:uncharacterized damage-inducible protein DinB
VFRPAIGLGPLWKQFRHVGRVEGCYLDALSTGRMAFGLPQLRYAGDPTRDDLRTYLRELDRRLLDALTGQRWDRTIDWDGEPVDLFEHLSRLVQHETLHHGEWIAYVLAMGKPFPESWQAWGL